MVFQVEITCVTMRVDQFFKMGFLRDEVWLGEKKASTTTVGFPWCTLEAFALCKQALDWPESCSRMIAFFSGSTDIGLGK